MDKPKLGSFCLSVIAILMTLTPLPAVEKLDIATESQRINKAFEAEQRAFFEAQKKATTDEEREKIKFPDRDKYVSQMLALVEKNPKDPAAIDALVWALGYSRHNSEPEKQAIELFRKHFFDSEQLEAVCQVLAMQESEASEAFLKDVIEKNPHQSVKGAASLALGQVLKSTDAKRAEQYLNDVVQKYGTGEQKDTAKRELFEMHNLAIGKVAPEIEGEDVDGKRFKSTDYRGKVLVLDFWGDW